MSRRDFITRCSPTRRPLIAPSLLRCDFANLETEIRGLQHAGAQLLHLDVMDGHFVPNLSYGLPIVEAINRSTELPLDVHLMISNPAQYIERFAEAGADSLTIHIEATDSPESVLGQIQQSGASAGIAINPPTPISAIEPLLDHCDLVLVMSVMPGFGGQSFDPVALEKLTSLRSLAGDDLLLEVDGGVNEQTIGRCVNAGADLLVVGSAIFGHDNYGERLEQLNQLARRHHVTQG